MGCSTAVFDIPVGMVGDDFRVVAGEWSRMVANGAVLNIDSDAEHVAE